MKKKLISLLMTAAMVGSMMSGIVASASEETEAATEATTEHGRCGRSRDAARAAARCGDSLRSLDGGGRGGG